MNDSEFNLLAESALERIAAAFDVCGLDCDASFRGDGVLEVEFPGGAKLIANRHTAAREIWVAARAGGFHFRYEDGRWLGTRDGRDLMVVLGQLASDQTGQATRLGG